MTTVLIKKKDLEDKIEIQFRYVYEEAGENPDEEPEKVATGAFFMKKGATMEDIMKQLVKSTKDVLTNKKAEEVEKEIEINLEG